MSFFDFKQGQEFVLLSVVQVYLVEARTLLEKREFLCGQGGRRLKLTKSPQSGVEVKTDGSFMSGTDKFNLDFTL